MSRKLLRGLGTGKAVGLSGIGCVGSLETLADRIDLFSLHEAADGFIRANDLLEEASGPDGCLNTDVVLQSVEDAVEVGARLARQAGIKRPIQVVTGNDAMGACRFYFIGTVKEVTARLKRLAGEDRQ